MRYRRMPIEVESPEEVGYGAIRCNLAESSMRDRVLGDLGLEVDLLKTVLLYGDHRGHPELRALLAERAVVPVAGAVDARGGGALFIVSTSLLSAGDPSWCCSPTMRPTSRPARHRLRRLFVDLAIEQGSVHGETSPEDDRGRAS
jgi:hypothetical protein